MALRRACLSSRRCLALPLTSPFKVRLHPRRNLSCMEAVLIDPVFWFTGQGVAISLTRMAGQSWRTAAKVGLGFTTVTIASGAYIYKTFASERNLYTGRKQFLQFASLDRDPVTRVGKTELKEIPTLSAARLEWMRLKKVVQELMCANGDNELLQPLRINVEIVDTPRINSYILPTGHIAMSVGLINSLKTEEELAFLVSRDIAHAALQHGKERGANQKMMAFLSYPATILTTLCYSTIGNPIVKRTCLLASVLGFMYMTYQLHLIRPYSELMELEADQLGQELSTKACYGVKGGLNFLSNMNPKNITEATDYSLYHPHSSARVQALKDQHDSLVRLQMRNCQKLDEVKKFAKELMDS